jgi:hypothetical protein
MFYNYFTSLNIFYNQILLYLANFTSIGRHFGNLFLFFFTKVYTFHLKQTGKFSLEQNKHSKLAFWMPNNIFK